MPEPNFADLLDRARAGDAEATAELVGRFEPRVRASVRRPLDGLNLRRVLDSGDISQAVLGQFFARLADGAFDLADEDRVAALLVAMARNRVRDQARREHAARRGGGAMVPADHLFSGLAGADPTPSRVVSGREVVEELFARLPADVRLLAEGRAAGRGWADLAAEYGSTPQALRKKMARAVERLADDLGL
jgi:DNA-directed RNA polymerase specialized sigma24 family protein